MPNDNYTALIAECTLGESVPFGYRAASVGAFNVQSSAGDFAAYCNVLIDSSLFSSPAVPPSAQFLWGNADDVNNTGWALRLIVTGDDQLSLSAQVGDGSTFAAANYALTGANRSNPGNRLIHAGLVLHDSSVYLTVNGGVVAQAGGGTIAYVGSQYGACLGTNPIANSSAAAACAFSACGFATWNMYSPGTLAQLMGEAFLAEQAVFGNGNLLYPDFGVDWQHRYSAKSAITGATSTIERSHPPTVAVDLTVEQSFGYPPGAAAIPDIGNRATSALTGFVTTNVAPVALNRTGAISPAQNPITKGRKNLSWYTGGAITFT